MTQNAQKTFKNRYNVSCNRLFLWLLFVPLMASAQLFVQKSTSFSVNGILVSQEKATIFQSSVLGNGTLFITSNEKQTLFTSANVTLPNLSLNVKKLVVLSSLILKGDILVTSGTLELSNKIQLFGRLQLSENAFISNQEFIEYQKTQLQLPNLSQNNIEQPIAPVFGLKNTKKTSETELLASKLTIKTVLIQAQYCIAPTTPPPEFS